MVLLTHFFPTRASELKTSLPFITLFLQQMDFKKFVPSWQHISFFNTSLISTNASTANICFLFRSALSSAFLASGITIDYSVFFPTILTDWAFLQLELGIKISMTDDCMCEVIIQFSKLPIFLYRDVRNYFLSSVPSSIIYPPSLGSSKEFLLWYSSTNKSIGSFFRSDNSFFTLLSS